MLRQFALTTALTAVLAVGLTSVAEAQTPEIDMEAVHRAYWKISGADPVAGLQWFEEEVNKFYNGEGYVSISADRENVGGEPRVVVRGYVDRDGVPGYSAADHQLFAFVQQGAVSGSNVNYELTDAWNNVYYRGSRSLPSTAFYSSYYGNRGTFTAYYTPSVRLSYLRTWRVGYRRSPVYSTWRGHFTTWRSGYGARVVRLRTTYGAPRARIVVHNVGVRASLRPSVRVSAGVRANVRPSVRVRATVPSVRVRATVPSVRVRATVPSVRVRATVPSVRVRTTVPSVRVRATVPAVRARATVRPVSVRATVRPTVAARASVRPAASAHVAVRAKADTRHAH